MRWLIVVLAACSSDGKSNAGKAEVECGASWAKTPPVAGTCDSACVEMLAASGPACTTTVVGGGTPGKIECQSTFEFEGEQGCCFDLGMEGLVNGVDEPKRQRRVFFLSCAD